MPRQWVCQIVSKLLPCYNTNPVYWNSDIAKSGYLFLGRFFMQWHNNISSCTISNTKCVAIKCLMHMMLNIITVTIYNYCSTDMVWSLTQVFIMYEIWQKCEQIVTKRLEIWNWSISFANWLLTATLKHLSAIYQPNLKIRKLKHLP